MSKEFNLESMFCHVLMRGLVWLVFLMDFVTFILKYESNKSLESDDWTQVVDYNSLFCIIVRHFICEELVKTSPERRYWFKNISTHICLQNCLYQKGAFVLEIIKYYLSSKASGDIYKQLYDWMIDLFVEKFILLWAL